jgi:hypothetical protein
MSFIESRRVFKLFLKIKMIFNDFLMKVLLMDFLI